MAPVAAPLPHHNRRPKTRAFGIYIGQVDEALAATPCVSFAAEADYLSCASRDRAAADAVYVLFLFELVASYSRQILATE